MELLEACGAPRESDQLIISIEASGTKCLRRLSLRIEHNFTKGRKAISRLLAKEACQPIEA